jgi:O-antigen/teichoic acid export membrane protein
MSLKQKTIKGLLWSALSQSGKLVSQFVITAILARILSPVDFGLVAMASVFTGFAMIFGELGISSALVQKLDVKDDHWSSAFWFNLFVGSILTLFFILVAPFISVFYKKPELTAVLQVLSLNFIFSSFTIVQQTILTREMNFRSLMIRDIAAVIIAGIVGIFMACRGWGVWSLVAQSVVFSAMNGLLLWTLSSWRPRFIFSRQAIKDIFHFSANMTGFQVVNYFARNVDQLLIGKFLGSQALGYYSLAYKLMLLPLQNISWMISRVMFPAFSQIQNDVIRLKENYLKMVKYISIVTFPLMIILFFAAHDLVLVVYGPKWELAIVLIQILVFCGMVQSIGTTVGIIYQSLGRADIQFLFSLFISLPSVVIAILIGLRKGIIGVAVAYTIRSIVITYVSCMISNRLLKLPAREFLFSFQQSLQITIFIVIVMSAVDFIKFPNIYTAIITKAGLGLVFYFYALFYLKIFDLKNINLKGLFAKGNH